MSHEQSFTIQIQSVRMLIPQATEPTISNDRDKIAASTRAVLASLLATAVLAFSLPWLIGWLGGERRTTCAVSPALRISRLFARVHQEPLNQRGAMLSEVASEYQWHPQAWVRVIKGRQSHPSRPGLPIEPENIGSAEFAFQIMARDRWTVVIWYPEYPHAMGPLFLFPYAAMGEPGSTQAELVSSSGLFSGRFTLPNPD